jgi:4-carboxymuconolactone decarboxylase
MAKLPYVSREMLPDDKRHVYDRIAETRGSVPNIFGTLLNSPDAAEVVTSVGEYIRYRSALDPATREIAILSVAREMNAAYEWAQHEPIARAAGVSDGTIEAIRSGRAPMGIPAKEGVFAQAVREVLRKGKMSDLTYQAIEHLLGPQQTMDLVVLVGYYSMLARILATFEVDVDDGLEVNFPDLS